MELSINRWYIRTWVFLCFCWVGSALYAAESPDTLYVDTRDVYPIGDHLYWMRADKPLSAEGAYQLFMDGNGQRLAPNINISAGLGADQYWLTLTLHNSSTAEQRVFYEFNYPFMHHIEVYKQTASGFEKEINTGVGQPFSTRGYPFHDFVFPIRLQGGETATFLMMAESGGMRFSTTPRLVSDIQFAKKEQRLYAIVGAIVGIMLFNVLINLFLGASLKDNIHYLYAAYVMAALAWVLGIVGLSDQFLFPEQSSVTHIYHFVTSNTTIALMAQLTIVFLQLKKYQLWMYYVLSVCMWMLLLVVGIRVGAYIFSLEQDWIKLVTGNTTIIVTAVVAIGNIWAAVVRIWQGYKPAWFYLAAMCFLVVSIFRTCYFIWTTNDLSKLFNPPTEIQIGLIIESLIIFVGIIYRYSIYKREKNDLIVKLVNQKLEMTGNVIAAQEEERKRLAQDLHDDLGATLSTLLLHITNQPTSGQEEHHAHSIAVTKKALADLRDISHDLLPKDFSGLGIVQALRYRIKELNTFTETKFLVNADGDDQLLSEMQAITLYRIANELLNNTIKHARASQVNVDFVIADDRVTLIVEDNGIGFSIDHNQNGIGMKNTYSRVAYLNGEINVDNNKRGTTVIIVAPL